MKYREHEKLKEVAPYSQKIGEFLDWLESETDFVIAKYLKDPGSRKIAPLYPAQLPRNEVLAAFFKIDLKKLEKEKEAMFEELRGGK